MKPAITYQWCLLFLLAAVGFISCNRTTEKKLDTRVTLFRNDKIPYGTYYAYNNLRHIFPVAEIEVNRKPISTYALASETDKKLVLEGSRYEAMVIICKYFGPTEQEANALQGFIAKGGHVFVSAGNFSQVVMDSLHMQASGSGSIYDEEPKGLTVDNPVTHQTDSFYYPGYPLSGYFYNIDSSITSIIGHNGRGNPNFVKFDYESGGSLQLHIAPLALTNFFLLHKENKKYYDAVMSYIPSNVNLIYWDDFFRVKRREEEDNNKRFSALSWLQKQPGLAMAFWLTLLLALVVYLFESKRRQRAIPLRKPLKNATVEFARTVGRLYLQRKDNNNLAHKMAAIFSDRVRRQFNVRTTMDDDFITKLSHKSGYNKTALSNLVYQLKYAQAHPDVSDLELLELQKQLDHFYQNT